MARSYGHVKHDGIKKKNQQVTKVLQVFQLMFQQEVVTDNLVCNISKFVLLKDTINVIRIRMTS